MVSCSLMKSFTFLYLYVSFDDHVNMDVDDLCSNELFWVAMMLVESLLRF